MSDNEELDITKALINAESDSEADTNDSDDYMSGGESEVDEIPENIPSKASQKPAQKPPTVDFMNLEESDNEEDPANQDSNIASYFLANNPEVKKAKAGSFQSFGLSKFLLHNILRKGFRQPTPIQRKTIPLIMDNRDVVGMARTGSGKTAAFVLPLIEKLKSHSPRQKGARAIILSPSRELALQTFKQVKEFGSKSDLRSILLVGGDSLDEQFTSMMSNPDIIIATPGRFMHLKVEMELDLKAIEYIVFDEADRLFELGFAEQLNELIASLPPSRQTLLFSATLPKSLVEFAKAGLSNPTLVRLDADAKISDQLEMAYITTKRNEREANLLFLLQDIIKMPLPTEEQIAKIKAINSRKNDSDDEDSDNEGNQNRKRKLNKFKKERLPPANQLPSKHSTIVFAPTKHHVEYLTQLLRQFGYLVSYIYGSLDHTARKNQLYQFRIGLSSIMVVTDVAARGIDIPILANVINYTLPSSSKIFIHRVGRTARAGNKGWAYSIVNEKELPYLLDLEIFLGKKLLTTSMHEAKCRLLKERYASEGRESEYQAPKVSYTDRLVIGSAPRPDLENSQEVYETLMHHNYDLNLIRDVSLKGEKLFYKSRQAASVESVRRTKSLVQQGLWDEQHLLFGPNLEKEKLDFLNKLSNRHTKDTVFEFNKRGREKEEDSMVEFMNKRRKQLAPIQRKAKERKELMEREKIAGLSHTIEDEILNKATEESGGKEDLVDEAELAEYFQDGDKALKDTRTKYKPKKSYKDPEFYMSHYAPTSDIQDKQLAIENNFTNNAASASFDLNSDDKMQVNKQIMRWDKKKGKYYNALSTDKKYIISESGQRIPATFRSGRFEEWKKHNPNMVNGTGAGSGPGSNGPGARPGASSEPVGMNHRFKHKQDKAPKMPDKYRDDYHKQKKKVSKAIESGKNVKGHHKPGAQSELKSTEQIRRDRQLKEKRKAKNSRPTKRR